MVIPIFFLFISSEFRATMAVPTTITGKHYKCEDCKPVLHRPLICQFRFHNKPVSENRAIKHLGKPFTTLSFGPFYSKSLEAYGKWEARKKQFWEHVLRSSEEPETTRSYVEAIKRVQIEARALYENDDSINHLSRDDFILMMIKDGCFMLQAAIYVLGGWKLLGYPNNIFGEQGDRDEIDSVVLVLFVLGNQIPLIILKELMKQSFFQKVLHSGKWNRPMDLPRRALFDFLIVPAMTGRAMDEPSDILHGFWILLAGPRCSTHDAGENDDSDESSSNDEYDNEFLVVPNATKLQVSGITFEDNGGMGTRGIRFNKTWFGASVSLPSIVINSGTEVVLRNLMRYEFVQQMGPNGREACAYLQLMCELIHTPDDAKLLADSGIIYCRPTLEKELPKIFNRLYLPDVKCNRNVHLVRNQIRSYQRCRAHLASTPAPNPDDVAQPQPPSSFHEELSLLKAQSSQLLHLVQSMREQMKKHHEDNMRSFQSIELRQQNLAEAHKKIYNELTDYIDNQYVR